MPLELQRWFNILCGILGLVTAFGLLLHLQTWIPEDAMGAQISLIVLYASATAGLTRVYRLAMAVLLSRWRPELHQRTR